jgi:acetylornithine deacetylase/succinyl-diaminopimelate desuccinylase-like protein
MIKELSEEEIKNLLIDLVALKSPFFHEHEIMQFSYKWLRTKGLPCRIHQYYDDTATKFHGENICGVIEGDLPGPTLYISGHLDTVDLCEGWTHPPYDPVIDGNRLYGVGALDMKGGAAAIMVALSEFYKRYGSKIRGKIIYQLVSDEEGPYGLGTFAVIKDNIDGIADPVDFAIICEPSAAFTATKHPCICLGARGGYDYNIHLYGKSAHAATPELGLNVLSDLPQVVTAIEGIQPITDDKLGKSTTCIIGIDGKSNGCSIPDHVNIEVFHHCVRGETPASIKADAENALLQANIKSKWQVELRQSLGGIFDGGFVPYCTDEDNPYVKLFSESVEKVCGVKPAYNYFQSMGDFNHIGGLLGIPTILFGPDGANFHSHDEYVLLDSVYEIAETLLDFLVCSSI